MPAWARVIFADVGQGDCTIVVDNESREAMVVDCPSKNVDKIHGYLTSEGLELKTLVVTHWDRDHYGGVARLAKAHQPSLIHYNQATLFPDERGVRGIKSTLKQFLELPWETLRPADDQQSGRVGSIRWRILAPTHAEITAAVTRGNRNVASCVVQIHAGGTCVLIGGDAVSSTWARVINDGVERADVLRWPHHGAELHGDVGQSVAQGVLARIGPAQVVVSVGASNSYGHPSASVIRLVGANSQVMCTGRTGVCASLRSGPHPLCGASVLMEIDVKGYDVSSIVL